MNNKTNFQFRGNYQLLEVYTYQNYVFNAIIFKLHIHIEFQYFNLLIPNIEREKKKQNE